MMKTLLVPILASLSRVENKPPQFTQTDIFLFMWVLEPCGESEASA